MPRFSGWALNGNMFRLELGNDSVEGLELELGRYSSMVPVFSVGKVGTISGGVCYLVLAPVIKHLPDFLSPPMEDHLNFLEQIPQSPPQRKSL